MLQGGTSALDRPGGPGEFDTSQLVAPPILFLSEAQSASLREAEHPVCDYICSIIFSELTERQTYLSLSARQFDVPARRLLLATWRLAEQFSHRGVRTEHLIIVLLSSDGGHRIAGGDQADRLALLTGALLRATHYRGGGSIGPPSHDVVRPNGLVVEWFGEAAKRAAARGYDAEICVNDLLDVCCTTDCDPVVHTKLVDRLNSLKHIGRINSQLELARQRIQTSNDIAKENEKTTAKGLAAITQSLETIDGKLECLARDISHQVNGEAARLADMKTGLTEIVGAQLKNLGPGAELIAIASDVASTRTGLAALDDKTARITQIHLPRIAANVGALHAGIASLDRTAIEIKGAITPDFTGAMGAIQRQLTTIDRRTERIEADVPRPPTYRWLALILAGVIAVGIATGLALSYLSTSTMNGADGPVMVRDEAKN